MSPSLGTRRRHILAGYDPPPNTSICVFRALFLTPTEYQQPRIVHQACCRACHRSDPACPAVTYIYHTLPVPVVPCWQPSTALTNPHTTAPHFGVLFSSICCVRTSAQPSRFVPYFCRRQSQGCGKFGRWTYTNQRGRLATVLGVLWVVNRAK